MSPLRPPWELPGASPTAARPGVLSSSHRRILVHIEVDGRTEEMDVFEAVQTVLAVREYTANRCRKRSSAA